MAKKELKKFLITVEEGKEEVVRRALERLNFVKVEAYPNPPKGKDF